MIPRVIHRVWVGRKRRPPEFEAYWDRWGELNPGWTRLTWDDWRLKHIALPPEFHQVRTLAGKADVARYAILAREGGVYVDCDEEPLRPLDELPEHRDAWACVESPGWIANGMMGCAPEHPAILDLLLELSGSVRQHGFQQPVHATGPGLLTREWLGRGDVTLFEPVTFYPVHWRDKATLGPPYPAESFGVQHWAHSWA